MAGFQQEIRSIQPVLAETYVDPIEPVDTSEAEAISAIGKGIAETYSGIQQGELREDLTGITQDYIRSHAEKNLAASSLPDAVVNKAHLELQTAEDEEEARFFNDPVVNSAREEVTRLSNAVEAGVMSDSQLKIRVQAKMREYINRAPGLGQHFRRLTSEVLGDYDAVLDSIAANDKAQSKQGDFLRKKVYDQASRNNLDLTLPYEQLLVQNNSINNTIRGKDELVREKEALAADRRIQGDSVRRGWSKYMSGEFIQSTGLAFSIENDPQFPTKEDKIRQLEMAKLSYEARIKGHAEDFISNDRLTSTLKTTSGMFDEYIRAVGEGRKLKTLQNERAVTDLLIQNDYFKKNPGLETASVLLKTIPSELLQFSEQAMFLTTNIVKAINQTAFGGEGLSKKELKDYYKTANKYLADLSTDPDAVIGAEDLNSILMGPLLNFDKNKLSNDQIEHLSSFMARDEAKKFITKLPEQDKAGTVSELNSVFDNFLEKRWMPNLMKDVAESIATQIGPTKATGVFTAVGREDLSTYIESSISPAGALRFTAVKKGGPKQFGVASEEEVIQRELIRLNRTYAGRFNQLVKAKAHLTGGTYPDVATEYYNQYFGVPNKKDEE